jgi:hypothetical protein
MFRSLVNLGKSHILVIAKRSIIGSLAFFFIIFVLGLSFTIYDVWSAGNSISHFFTFDFVYLMFSQPIFYIAIAFMFIIYFCSGISICIKDQEKLD